MPEIQQLSSSGLAHRATETLSWVSYKDTWGWNVGEDWIQVRFLASRVWHTGRKWRLSEHMTKSEIVQTALAAVLAAEEHETRELFLYHGQPIFSPHYNVDLLRGLWEAASRETRPGNPAVVVQPILDAR